MVLRYKNKNSGRVVNVLEPTEVEEQADAEAEALARKGTKKAHNSAMRVSEEGRKKAIHVRHTIERMDASEKWQRVSDSAPQAAPAAAPAAKKSTKRAKKNDDEPEAETTSAEVVSVEREEDNDGASSTGDN